MHANKKRVASVKQISKIQGSNSSEASLSRYRQNSWKNQQSPLDDVANRLNKCKNVCNSVNKRLKSNEKERLPSYSGSNSKYRISSSKPIPKQKKTEEEAKKPKYSNMKMLYQNAVYKSLNLNFSPSTSSVRSGTNSRDVSIKSKDNNSISKSNFEIDRNQEPKTVNFKFQIHCNINLSDRSIKHCKNPSFKKESKGKSQKYEIIDAAGIKGKITVSQERKNTVAQKFYSPSEARSIGNYKSNKELSVEKKFKICEKTTSKVKDNLYLSYRRSSKSGRKNVANSSKTRLLKEGSSINTDDTYEFKPSHNISAQQTATQENICIKSIPQNYQIKNISNLNHSKNKEEISCTVDSARNSEISSSCAFGQLKEYLEAAKQGNKEKINEMLNLNYISDINCADSKFNTALHYATNEGKYKVVNYLLERGINPNLKNQDMETALHIACKRGYK